MPTAYSLYCPYTGDSPLCSLRHISVPSNAMQWKRFLVAQTAQTGPPQKLHRKFLVAQKAQTRQGWTSSPQLHSFWSTYPTPGFRISRPQIAVAPAVAKMIAPIIWACAIAKLMAQPAQQMMAKLMAEMAQQKMAKLMAEMAEMIAQTMMANLILGWENSKVLTELEDRTLRQTAPALSVTWTMHVASVSRLAVAFTVGNLFQREERAESSKEKSGPKKCERCDISFASPMSCVNVND